MKQTNFYIPTTKDIPKDSTVLSHKLLIKSGMVKQLVSGVYTYMPIATIIIDKIKTIIKEELNKIESYEIVMPIIQPKEIWDESGRWIKYGKELVRFEDRHKREFCLSPTCEEVVIQAIRDNINSYKKLPLSLYQIQTKIRDELRPRFGLMRSREFIMMDAYSFHSNSQSLISQYEATVIAYRNIFKRIGLLTKEVTADSGNIGGDVSKEFMALSDIGEDTIVHCDSCDYSVNIEKATSKLENILINETNNEIVEVETGDNKSIEEVSTLLNIPSNEICKSLVYFNNINKEYSLVCIRGDLEINENKLHNVINSTDIRLANDTEISDLGLIKGNIGPYNINSNKKLNIIIDESIKDIENICMGANKSNKHVLNINVIKDCKYNVIADIRLVKNTDSCNCGGNLSFSKGIEVGHLFQLGDIYTEKMNAKYLDQNGKQKNILMGSYGIGVTRVIMAVLEQLGDLDKGIIWPEEITPFKVHILVVNINDDVQMNHASDIYKDLISKGIPALLDNRKERIGSKFKDADLIGIPKRIVVGKDIVNGNIEFIDRNLDTKTITPYISIIKEI